MHSNIAKSAYAKVLTSENAPGTTLSRANAAEANRGSFMVVDVVLRSSGQGLFYGIWKVE